VWGALKKMTAAMNVGGLIREFDGDFRREVPAGAGESW
jgi:hypothetical protein